MATGTITDVSDNLGIYQISLFPTIAGPNQKIQIVLNGENLDMEAPYQKINFTILP